MTVVAIAHRREDGVVELAAPSVGWFRVGVAIGDVVRAGGVLGQLEVLGTLVAIVAPDGAAGAVVARVEPSAARPPVGYGTVIVTLDPSAARDATASRAHAPATAADGLVFRSPTSGRYYGRPSPDKPPFVTVGAELAAGTTVCLLEVMKTFNRIAIPTRARVTAILVAEGADVTAGEPLLALEP